MHRAGVWLAVCLTLMLTACARQPPAVTPPVLKITQAEAAPADWNSTAPPADGWTPVTLMDLWDKRWPQHDGVVWYRLRWNQADANTPVGLLLDYVCLADAVYINGSLIHRDPQLIEPLSRSWVMPQYFLLDKPLLRTGENILLVRVSGLAGYQPGLGNVTAGDPHTMQAQYRSSRTWRYDVQLFDQAVGVVLGSLFAMLWLFRRKDTTYGWFALSTLISVAYAVNFIASSTWPFASTDAWEAFNTAFYLASASTFAVFLLRFAGRRWPRIEMALLLLNLGVFALSLLAPNVMGPHRGYAVAAGALIYYSAIFAFIGHALRSRHTDGRVLAACLLVPVLVSGHDLLVFFGAINSERYLLALTSPLTLLGMGFVLAYRFAAAMHRAEGFNVELKHEVDVATTQLGNTLANEHALALANTRINERLNLVRDLHDGFGGSLLGAIATLENQPASPDSSKIVGTLKELRDDLRLVIDTTTNEQATDLADLLAPLRHRWSQRLDMANIDSRWQLDGLDNLHLDPNRSLDLLRLLQEALTNVLKHSHAVGIDVSVRRMDQRLCVEIRDDGHGFDPTHGGRQRGAGLASLRTRAARLGDGLTLDTAPGRGVVLRFDVHL